MAIREASANIETFSLRKMLDIEDIALHDAGNVDVSQKLEETLRRVRLIVADIIRMGKTPILIGGEHTITYGAVQGTVEVLGKEIAVVSFDAHLDLRDEYLGETLSHTTFMRRTSENIGPNKIVITGVRAVSKGELKYADQAAISYIPVTEVRRMGAEATARQIRALTSQSRGIYVTIDFDVLDPAFAPGVGNPESDGLSPDTLISILNQLCDDRVIGLDLVEVSPHYDSGATAAAAARVLFEAICSIEVSRREVQ